MSRHDSDATWLLATGTSRARLAGSDGRLESLELGGHSLIVADDGGGPWSWGGFVMAPWTSLIRDATFRFAGSNHRLATDDGRHAVLGLTWKLPWQRVGDRLVCDLAAARDSGWPFGGTVWQKPILSDHGFELAIGLTAGPVPMPAAIGWHPWFRRTLSVGDPVELELGPVSWRQGRDRTERPDGTWTRVAEGGQEHNDCLQTSGPTRLVWPGCGSLEVQQDAPWTTLYSTNPRGICVEPVTSPAEQMIHVLQPGEEIVLRIGLRWTAN